MTTRRAATLSKSRFTYGLQCLKRLYLYCYHYDLADAVDARTQALFDTGNRVGELARQRFPGGVLVEEDHFHHQAAVTATGNLLNNPQPPPLYEAAFNFEGIRIRADILNPIGNGAFDLMEVKSTTRYDADRHLADVAIQLYVLEQSGIPVNRAYLMHLNRDYVYPGGDYDLEQLFSLTDVTEAARQFVSDSVPTDLARMWAALQQDAPPDIAIGAHCKKPYQCSFYGHCHQDAPENSLENPIIELYGVSENSRVFKELTAAGIQEIGRIPPGFPGISSMNKRIRESVVTGQTFVGPQLAADLSALDFPVSFLDFETFMPALPLYVGTRPYQTITFQWSLHIQEADGRLSHREFLNDDAAEPRERAITSLLEAVPPAGSIVVYSGYEERMLKELAAAFPRYAQPLAALSDRLYDLCQLVRDNYYHPDFHGSFSLKSVFPALVPGDDYSNLEIQEGSAASSSYWRLIAADPPEPERAQIRQDLLEYCKKDTEATVKVLAALRALAGM